MNLAPRYIFSLSLDNIFQTILYALYLLYVSYQYSGIIVDKLFKNLVQIF